MEIIRKHFPEITIEQSEKFEKLHKLFVTWNEQINLVSRKDIDHFSHRHLLHSLSIAKFITFKKGAEVLDVGTGGGLPGIPLAILFPETRFHLIDSIGKKIKVVSDIIENLELDNVTTQQIRVEDINRRFDFVVSRAVSALPKFMELTSKSISRKNIHEKKNGILYLKGGDFDTELNQLDKWLYQVFDLDNIFPYEFFETKKLVYLYR